jgi:hypothetical protein
VVLYSLRVLNTSVRQLAVAADTETCAGPRVDREYTRDSTYVASPGGQKVADYRDLRVARTTPPVAAALPSPPRLPRR